MQRQSSFIDSKGSRVVLGDKIYHVDQPDNVREIEDLCVEDGVPVAVCLVDGQKAVCQFMALKDVVLVPKKIRKVVQIAFTGHLVCLCDDGTIWQRSGLVSGDWCLIDDVPQTKQKGN